jgi:hypothetical protein
VAIPSQPIKAAIIPLLTPPLAIAPLPHRIPIPRGDLLPDQGEPTLPYPPTFPTSPASEGDGQMGPEEYTTPRRMDTPIPDSLFRAGTPIDAYKSVGSTFVPTPSLASSPTTRALGSGSHSPVSPPVAKKKSKRQVISDDHPIATYKY